MKEVAAQQKLQNNLLKKSTRVNKLGNVTNGF